MKVPDELRQRVQDAAEQAQASDADTLARILKMGLSRWDALRKYADKQRVPAPDAAPVDEGVQFADSALS